MAPEPLALAVMPGLYAVTRLAAEAPLPSWATRGSFYSITRTWDELSVVCPAQDVPPDVQGQADWCLLQVAGPLDFSLVGVLAALTEPLALAGISVFAISTHDTDYLLVPAHRLDQAVVILRQSGHQVT